MRVRLTDIAFKLCKVEVLINSITLIFLLRILKNDAITLFMNVIRLSYTLNILQNMQLISDQ